MNNTKALIFDFDGVIADTFDICYQATKRLDPLLTPEEYRARFLGNINEHVPERIIENKENFDFYATYTPDLFALAVDAQVEKIILELSKKYPLFIVSSTESDPIRTFLAQNNLSDCFKEIYGNDIHKSKVEKTRMILDKYALNPAHCLFITDTVGDIREARKCGVGAIAVSWGFHSTETLSAADPVTIVDSLTDLTHAIERTFAEKE